MKNSEIILNTVAQEDPYRRRQAEFEVLSRKLAEKELALATLENQLSIFELRYTRVVGILFAELDRLDREIARENYRLNPKGEYHKTYQRAARKARTSQEDVNKKTKHAVRVPFKPTKDMKKLYRKVAKTIHPDFAVNEAEQAFRTELMARANEAYRNGDKEALEQILYEWEHRDESLYHQAAVVNEQNQLEQKIKQIKVRLKQIEARIRELKKSELYRLMLKVKQADQIGRDLLREMAVDLEKRILEAEKLLDSLKPQSVG